MELSRFSALMVLCISSILVMVTACGTTGHKRYPLEGFPETGWKMYPSPTEDEGPGTVIGITDKGARYPIRILDMDLPSPRKESPPAITSASHSNLEMSAFGKLAFGPEGADFSGSANKGKTVKTSLSIKNANRIGYTDQDLEKSLLSIAESLKDQIFQYKKYVVIQEVITGTGIDYELTQDSFADIGGEAGLKAIIEWAKIEKGIKVKYKWDEDNKTLLHVEYESPMNIIYLEHEFDPVRLYELKKKRESGPGS